MFQHTSWIAAPKTISQDWRPMERHPRPLRRRNPEEMGFFGLDFALTLHLGY